MSVNQKQMYLILSQQVKSLELQLQPANSGDKVNEIPENFNEVGWDLTIEKAEQLIAKMRELKLIKGKRLTPQFYRSIYNRCLIGITEIDRTIESIAVVVEDIDYEVESIKLMSTIQELTAKVKAAEAIKLAEQEELKAAEAIKLAEQEELKAAQPEPLAETETQAGNKEKNK